MPEYTMQDAKEAVDELHKTLKVYGVESQEHKQAAENTEKVLAWQEACNQKLVSDLEIEAKAREAQDVKLTVQDEKLHEMELELARNGGTQGIENWKAEPQYATFKKWFCEGDKAMSGDEFDVLKNMDAKTLRTDIDTGAGYLTMPEMDTSITKTIEEISPVRSVARVRSTTKKVLDVPIRTGIPTATYEGEAAAGDDSESTYGSEQLTSFRLTVTVPFTRDQLMDSSFDLESEINSDVAESMAKAEGNKFVLGTGVKQPEGFLVNAAVVAAAVTSAVTAGFNAADLTTMTGALKVGYDPMYGFNRQTLAYARSLEDSAGRPIWQLTLADKAPNTINGEPYIVLQDMPVLAANSLSVVYGDFRRGYTITDRTGLMIIRDEYTLKKKAIIEMTFHKWNTGQVILSEAFTLLKSKT